MTRAALALSVQFADDLGPGWRPDRAQVRRWVRATLDLLCTTTPTLLTVRFTGEREARALNRAHRGADYVPNVLTFNLHEGMPLGGAVESDVVVCLPVVAREARAQRKDVKSHCAHLVVHGVLHAHGHDHLASADAERMEAVERRVLARFRISDPYAPR